MILTREELRKEPLPGFQVAKLDTLASELRESIRNSHGAPCAFGHWYVEIEEEEAHLAFDATVLDRQNSVWIAGQKFRQKL